MMGPGEDPDLADLAAELAATGFSPAQILKVIRNARGGSVAPERRTRATGVAAESPERTRNRKPRAPRPGYVTHEQVLGALLEKGLTAQELEAALPSLDHNGTIRHLRRALDFGNVMKVGNVYSLTENGRVNARARPGAAPPEPFTRRTRISRADVLAKLRAIGTSSVEGLRQALGGKMRAKSVWQHLDRGTREGTVKKHDTTPLTFSVVGREAKVRGKNDERIANALKAARGPLDLAGFVAHSPEFKRMNAGAQQMALSNAVKRGVAVRLAKGVYGLPGRAAAHTVKAKKLPKGAKPAASEPAKPVDAKPNGAAAPN